MQPSSWLEATNCVFSLNGADGMNLYQVTGRVQGCMIAHNEDEGIHSTHAHQLQFLHNIFAKNQANNLHVQLGEEVSVHNNLIALADSGTESKGSYGLVVGGGVDSVYAVDVANNLFLSNRATALKIQPAEVVVDSITCVPIAAQVRVRSNLFFDNARDPGEGREQVELSYMDRGHPGMSMEAGYNSFGSVGRAANVALDSTNTLGIAPAFVAVPDSIKINGVRSLKDARQLAHGLALEPDSPAVDAGDPADRDGGGLSQGAERADQGIFGGPMSDW
jgi:hypothetical protein